MLNYYVYSSRARLQTITVIPLLIQRRIRDWGDLKYCQENCWQNENLLKYVGGLGTLENSSSGRCIGV